MKQFIEYIPNHENMFLGFSVGTAVTLIWMIVVVLIIRSIVGVILPKVFSTISSSSEGALKALSGSGNALGTAVGAALLHFQLGDLDHELVIMPEMIESFLPGLVQFVMVVSLVMCAFRAVGIVHAVVIWTDDDGVLDGSQKTVVSAAESVLKFLTVIFGAVFIADSLGLDLTTLVAGLGITGLALALAAQDTISNIFGATTVLLDRPFKVGDWIIIGSVEGEVMEIGLRTTLIRTSIDTVITMPNANLTNTPVENWGKRRFRRWQPIFKLDINSDPDSVEAFCQGVATMIEKNEKTMKEESSFARVSSLGPNAIDIGCNVYWDITSGKEEREERDSFLLGVMSLAKKNKISFYDLRTLQNS